MDDCAERVAEPGHLLERLELLRLGHVDIGCRLPVLASLARGGGGFSCATGRISRWLHARSLQSETDLLLRLLWGLRSL